MKNRCPPKNGAFALPSEDEDAISASHLSDRFELPNGSKSFIVSGKSNEDPEKMQHTFLQAAVRILSSTSSVFTNDLDTETDEEIEIEKTNSFSSSDHQDGNAANDET